MAKTWGEPQKKEVMVSAAKEKDGAQVVGAFGPIRGVPAWEVRFKGDTYPVKLFLPAQPKEGDVLEVVMETEEKDGKTYKNWFTVEQKEKLSQPGGGGGGFRGGGGFKPAYTTEQQATKDSLELAILSLKGGLIGNDNSIIPCSLAAVEKLQERFYSKIMGAKSPQPEAQQ